MPNKRYTPEEIIKRWESSIPMKRLGTPEEFGALAAGAKKLNLIKGKDIEAQVYGGVENGLGSADYEIEEVPFTERPALLEGAVGLVSTVPDFLRFGQMLANGGELEGVEVVLAGPVGDEEHPGAVLREARLRVVAQAEGQLHPLLRP